MVPVKQLKLSRPLQQIAFLALVIKAMLGVTVDGYAQEVESGLEASVQQERIGVPIEVPLPLTLAKSAEVKQTLKLLLDKMPTINEQRPVFVLQFETLRGATGEGSDFHACASLAEFLASSEMARVEVVGFVPESRSVLPQIDEGPTTKLVGHAVLVALACEAIVVHKSAGIGQAGIDTQDITPPMLATYQFVSGQRSPLPEPVMISMLDKQKTLMEVKKNDGSFVYVDQKTQEQLVRDGKSTEFDPLSVAGELPLFDAKQLTSFSTNCRSVDSRTQLADLYGIDPTALEADPSRGTRNKAIQVELPGDIDQQSVDWSIRAMDARVRGDINMIIVKIDADSGDLQSCLQMARYLADFNDNEVRTVAYVDGKAQGPPALIALACNHLVMGPDARLGGLYEPKITQEDLELVRPTVEDLAGELEAKPWSLLMSMLDYDMELERWQHKNNRSRLFSKAEHEQMSDAKMWSWMDVQPMGEGLSGDSAWKLGIAKYLANDFQGLQAKYDIDAPETLTPTKTDKMIEELAQFLASPFISFWLLFGAMFFISTEMSNPGISVPGFLGALCVILFFWSQYLDGNAHWLEILLFVAGVIFILMEIFVLPGLGVFGIGGLLMVVSSIVLASQTFIIPRNSEDFARLPVSLGMVAAAGGGFLVALAVLRKVLPNTPYFKKMMLEPPVQDNELADREAVVDWSDLMGKSGVSLTDLIPAGKARIAGQLFDVITDGRAVDKGLAIVVVEAVGNRIVVAPEDLSESS